MDTLQAILPYAIGLLVLPLPVVALILLLTSGRGGFRKATVFVLFWLITTYGAVLSLLFILGGVAEVEQNGQKPDWQYWVTVFMGGVLLVIALLTRLRVFRERHGREVRTPEWLKAIDRLDTAAVAGLAVALVIVNPVSLSMLLAASINLANLPVSVSEATGPVAAFVLIGGLSVLVPYIVVLAAGRRSHHALHAVRHWLVVYADRLSFWVALGFGAVFLYKGINGLT